MTTQEIKSRLEFIQEMAGDDEVAHSREDALMRDFIAYIAGLQSPASLTEKARLVLKSREIKFSRWCA